MLSKDGAGADTLEENAVIAYSVVGFFVFATCCMGGLANCCTGGEAWFVAIILAGITRVSVVIMAGIFLSTL